MRRMCFWGPPQWLVRFLSVFVCVTRGNKNMEGKVHVHQPYSIWPTTIRSSNHFLDYFHAEQKTQIRVSTAKYSTRALNYEQKGESHEKNRKQLKKRKLLHLITPFTKSKLLPILYAFVLCAMDVWCEQREFKQQMRIKLTSEMNVSRSLTRCWCDGGRPVEWH